MRIGLVCRHYLATKGGLEKYTLNLSEELVRRGEEVHVFCNTGEKKAGVQLHHVPMFPFSSPGKNFSFALNASRVIAEYELDVVQSMERIWSQDIFRASDGINPVQMDEKYPNPIWRTFKSAGPRRQVLSLLERRIFQKNGTRRIMTNSELVKNQIVEHYRVPVHRIAVIYNSVDTTRFTPTLRESVKTNIRRQFGIGQADRLVLFAGNDFQRKGLIVLLKALAIMNDPAVKLLVAGSDPPEKYRRFSMRNGIGDRVHFIGHHRQPERLYASADLFVLPTRYDAFANVCLEAMACGTPAITTRTNGASEIIENGSQGYVLDSWEAEELSTKMRAALDAVDGAAMRENAARTAAGFTMDRYMESLYSLYANVRGDHGV